MRKLKNFHAFVDIISHHITISYLQLGTFLEKGNQLFLAYYITSSHHDSLLLQYEQHH